MELLNILSSDAVLAGLKVGSKKRLLQEMAAFAASHEGNLSASECLDALQERLKIGRAHV